MGYCERVGYRYGFEAVAGICETAHRGAVAVVTLLKPRGRGRSYRSSGVVVDGGNGAGNGLGKSGCRDSEGGHQCEEDGVDDEHGEVWWV